MNHEEPYNTSNQIKLKTSMVRSDLCDYSDFYIIVNWNYNDYWIKSR